VPTSSPSGVCSIACGEISKSLLPNTVYAEPTTSPLPSSNNGSCLSGGIASNGCEDGKE
jgi:hypothetical protein